MTAKNLKFLQLFESFVNIDYINNKNLVHKSMVSFFNLDYALAVDVWDFLSSTKEDKLASDERFMTMISIDLLDEFYNRSSTKCIKAILDTPSIKKSIYQYSHQAGEGIAFDIVANIFTSNKLSQAEDFLKCYLKNERIKFGQVMKKILEHLFVEALKKNPAKIEINKKMSALLLTYVKKIKTDEKAMLEQRLREIQ